LGAPAGWFTACALAGLPTSAVGPGGLENRSGSEGALESPAEVVAVCTVKSMCESEGVVAFHDQRLHTGTVPEPQLLEYSRTKAPVVYAVPCPHVPGCPPPPQVSGELQEPQLRLPPQPSPV
jgi:hypothetical protein